MKDQERTRPGRRQIASAVLMVATIGVVASPGGAVAGPSAVFGQTVTTGSTPASRQSGTPNPLGPAFDPLDSPFADTTRQKRNDDRQRRIVSDTQRLVALANQLKAEIAASGAESMTPEMLRQMDEIEKLAKSVKDKMRD